MRYEQARNGRCTFARIWRYSSNLATDASQPQAIWSRVNHASLRGSLGSPMVAITIACQNYLAGPV
eukprot:1495074-Pleurochrysis_carterae.AAC.1